MGVDEDEMPCELCIDPIDKPYVDESGRKVWRACPNPATRQVVQTTSKKKWILNICEEHFARSHLSGPEYKAVNAWFAGKPPTVRFVIAELGDDGLVHMRASSDEKDDDGSSASGKNYIEALDALEKKLSEKLLS